MTKNNICIVISDLFFDFGGLEKQAVSLANFLSNRFNVHVFYRKYKTNREIKKKLNNSICLIPFSSRNDIVNILKIRKILTDINPVCLLAMYSWNEAEIWVEALKNTRIPLFYSEHNDPKIIEQRCPNRRKILVAADKIRVQWDDFVNNEFKNKTVVIGNRYWIV